MPKKKTYRVQDEGYNPVKVAKERARLNERRRSKITAKNLRLPWFVDRPIDQERFSVVHPVIGLI